MYAIRPVGVGKPVGARAIRKDWPLIEGETFVVDEYEEGMVLAENGRSLRRPTEEEKRESDNPPDPRADFFFDLDKRVAALEGKPEPTRDAFERRLRGEQT